VIEAMKIKFSDAGKDNAGQKSGAGQKLGPNVGMEGETISGGDAPMTLMEEVWDVVKTVGLAVLITLIFRIFFYQPFNIPTGSMQPNLLVGDFVLVSKGTYGYSKASLIWPLTRIDSQAIVFDKPVKRGEVVVFKNSHDQNKDYIKRVIGMPGDRVQTIGGILYINGTQVPREFVSNETVACRGYSPKAATWRETLPNGASYLIQECQGNNYELDNTGPFLVPADHYFMMGDNRDNSQDSRTRYVQYVPAYQIVGKAQNLVFSVDGKKSHIWEVWKWPGAIRYSRIFNQVE
jgi:signal peptidase I